MGITARDLIARRGSFSLDVPRFDSGGKTAVLGPNGAGKTTLIDALQGSIPIAGQVFSPLRTAAVFAKPAVLRGTTLWNVSEVVRLVCALDRGRAGERGERTLGEVGLGSKMAVDARSLSTGERQRLAIARALACEPEALFLDEPFANVDADARPGLRSLVARYCERTGCELIIATSFLADVVALSSDFVVLDRGRIVEAGSTREITACPNPYVKALLSEGRVQG